MSVAIVNQAYDRLRCLDKAEITDAFRKPRLKAQLVEAILLSLTRFSSIACVS